MKKGEYDNIFLSAVGAILIAIDIRRRDAGVAARAGERLNSRRGTKDCIMAARDRETPWT
jgi:hypothetical protein